VLEPAGTRRNDRRANGRGGTKGVEAQRLDDKRRAATKLLGRFDERGSGRGDETSTTDDGPSETETREASDGVGLEDREGRRGTCCCCCCCWMNLLLRYHMRNGSCI